MRFLYGEPAIFHKGALIIGDTHFGIEQRLQSRGIHYSDISEQMYEKIISLIRKTKAKKIIMLGDVKENIMAVDSITERIFERLQKKIQIIVTRGNHDGGIESVCANVEPSSGMVYEKLALVHGNAWPDKELMKQRYVVSGHQHPQIEMRDRAGKVHRESAWIVLPAAKTSIKKFYKKFNDKISLILMPAFNPLVGNTLKINAEEQLGPLLSNKLFKLNEALVYRLDGTQLGKLKDMQQKQILSDG